MGSFVNFDEISSNLSILQGPQTSS